MFQNLVRNASDLGTLPAFELGTVIREQQHERGGGPQKRKREEEPRAMTIAQQATAKKEILPLQQRRRKKRTSDNRQMAEHQRQQQQQQQYEHEQQQQADQLHQQLQDQRRSLSNDPSMPPTPRLDPDLIKMSEPRNEDNAEAGLDLHKALLKVMFRPNAQLHLGPVNASCSITISDVSLPDDPLVYCSDAFCRLTGYERKEVMNINCRFLQSPDRQLQKGAPRVHTDQAAVYHLKRNIEKRRESQASFLNYKKDGTPFINLVTIVPIDLNDSGHTTHMIGFQADLVKQPGAVLRQMENGSYVVDYTNVVSPGALPVDLGSNTNELKSRQAEAKAIADFLHRAQSSDDDRLAQIILNNSSDLIWAVSAGLDIVYMSPSSRAVLGFKPEELVGTSLESLLHPADAVQVFRDIKDVIRSFPRDEKDSSASEAEGGSATPSEGKPATPSSKAEGPGRGKTFDQGEVTRFPLRMRTAQNTYRWIDNLGTVHRDSARSRKSLILAGRPRSIYHVSSDILGGNGDNHIPAGRWNRLSREGIVLYSVASLDTPDAEGQSAVGQSVIHHIPAEHRAAFKEALATPYAVVLRHNVDPNPILPAKDVISKFFSPTVANGGSPHDRDVRWIHTIPTPADNRLQANIVYRCPEGATDEHGAFHSSIFSEFLSNHNSAWMVELRQMQVLNKRLRDEVKRRRDQQSSKSSKSSKKQKQ